MPFYGRFGFEAEAAQGFQSPCAGPHFMVHALHEGLALMHGEVAYAPAFAMLA